MRKKIASFIFRVPKENLISSSVIVINSLVTSIYKVKINTAIKGVSEFIKMFSYRVKLSLERRPEGA